MGILVLSPDSTLVFLHTCGKLAISLAHKGAGAPGARDAIHDIPPSLRGKTFVIIKKDQVPSFHELFNTTLLRIQFTMEESTNDRLPFLDVLVQKLPSGHFETSVYRKETDADVVLHFDSKRPACHKRSFIKALFGRVKKHCSSEEARRQERTYLEKRPYWWTAKGWQIWCGYCT